jgi:UDP-GlcNAc:undecaprenyl-phosphate/decaprenyl-phosphate GlcNAc-1-phosphate transferase
MLWFLLKILPVLPIIDIQDETASAPTKGQGVDESASKYRPWAVYGKANLLLSDLLLHNNLALIFFPALLLSLWLTPVVLRYSFRLNAVDLPDARKVHERAVSRLGGVAMVAGLVLPLLFFTPLDRTMLAFLVGVLLVAATGFLDDVYRIPPAVKFAGEIAAAAAFVFLGGVSIRELGDLFCTGEIACERLGPALTIFCMVGVMNALNLADGLDGLAGGISAIAAIFLGLFAYLSADWVPLWIVLALVGSLFGFLRYNAHPAKLFMGDTGSLLLGYTLSAAAVMLVQNGPVGIHLAPVTVAAVLALPITDTLLVMSRRLRHGQNPFWPDRTHLHHQLMELGLPHAAVVRVLYLSAAAFGVQAWLLHGAPDWVQLLDVTLLAASIHGTVYGLQRFGCHWNGGSKPAQSPADPADTVMGRLLEKSVWWVTGAVAIGLAVPIIALPGLPPAFGGMAMAVLVFVAAMFPWREHLYRSSVVNGLIWFACLCLLALIQAAPGSPAWVPAYLAVMSAAVLLWVLLKMKYRGHREIVQVSAFEILLLGVVLFVALVVVPALYLGEGLRKMLLAVCMESAAFLLAMKILIRRQPRSNSMFATALLGALALIVVKGFVSTDTVANFLSAPAVASAPAGVSFDQPVVPRAFPIPPPLTRSEALALTLSGSTPPPLPH